MDTLNVGPFSWIATEDSDPGYQFHIYKDIALEYEGPDDERVGVKESVDFMEVLAREYS